MSRNRTTKEILICVLVVAAVLLITSRDANADFVFGTPANLGPTVNSSFWDGDPAVSADGLSLFFISDRSGGYGGFDVWVTTRETVQDPWGQVLNIGPTINSAALEGSGSISADGLSFYFISDRPGGSGNLDIWVTTRATIQDPWSDPVNLGSTVNSWAEDWRGVISADGLSLFFSSNRSGGYGSQDLWVSTRPTLSDPWGQPVNLGSKVNSSVYDYSPTPSPDGLRLFFSSNRPSEHGDYNIWVTERATRDDDWGTAVSLGPEVNSSADQENPCISADGSTLYFASTRPGGSGYVDLWQVSIVPIVDFNGDGIVDAADMCIMVDHWREGDSSFDIGPMPWGDGIVDVQDLTVLAEHLFEEVNDPTLVAHWTLDETEGMVVTDSAGDNNGYALGNPAWKPDGGRISGALEFDGIDDFISAAAPLKPADGAFSVLAWIKGGAPGQAIISSQGGSNWLSLDSVNGHLTTELAGAGQNSSLLQAETTITDGGWHRVGFVWDGSRRALCVDGVVVAEDTQDGLESRANGLYIGVGNDYAPNSFFSGMIDDVRIYSRAVSP